MVAAVYSFFVATVIYRELKGAQIYQVLVSAALTTSVVVFLVAAAMVSAWLITLSQISMQIADMFEPFVGNQTILLIVCGGDKRTQAADIERAVKCWDDYQRRLP